MKIQIRRNVFETNSSSVHSITMCSKDDFDKWENSNYYFYHSYNKPCVIGTKEEIIELLKSRAWKDGTSMYSDIDWDDEDSVNELFSEEDILTFDKYFDKYNEYFETFVEYYTTQKGEEVVAFGYCGYDG